MENIFSIEGKVAIITGAGGVLGSHMAKVFAEAGAKVVGLYHRQQSLDNKIAELKQISPNVMGFTSDVLDIARMEEIAAQVKQSWGSIDILLNIAGGNIPEATLKEEQCFFDASLPDWDRVTNLNMNGTVYPSYVFGKVMGEQQSGAIINISSMAAMQAMTRVPGYSAAKAAVANFTQWLATDLAFKFGDKIRVNAVAPGFFIGDQNRKILLNEDGSLTARSKRVMANTPMGRFGDISELNGAIQFLSSDAARFITGIVLPVDGGFSTYSGV